MPTSKRFISILALAFAMTSAGLAQEKSRTDTATTTTSSAVTTATQQSQVTTAARSDEEITSEDDTEPRQAVRGEFAQLLSRHPDELSAVIALDPTLLSNEPFLARYPELAQFLAAHPEIRRNPHYYVESYEPSRGVPYQQSAFDHFAEALSIIFVTGLIVSAFAWLVRTVIDQKRWSHLSRRQSEVHGKILDRLGSSDELLAYIKSPAGTKYLESAPIPLHSAPEQPRSPLNRIVLSVQIGVIIAAAGLGLLLVSTRFTGDAEQGFFAMGAVAFSIGAGFIISAFVSQAVAKRLGRSDETELSAGNVADDRGMMR